MSAVDIGYSGRHKAFLQRELTRILKVIQVTGFCEGNFHDVLPEVKSPTPSMIPFYALDKRSLTRLNGFEEVTTLFHNFLFQHISMDEIAMYVIDEFPNCIVDGQLDMPTLLAAAKKDVRAAVVYGIMSPPNLRNTCPLISQQINRILYENDTIFDDVSIAKLKLYLGCEAILIPLSE